MMKKILPLLLLVLLLVQALADQSVSLAWDKAASHTNVIFKIRAGRASGSYSVFWNAGTATTLTTPPLAPGLWFFVATAENPAGLESDPSNQISYTVPGVPDPEPQPFKPANKPEVIGVVK